MQNQQISTKQGDHVYMSLDTLIRIPKTNYFQACNDQHLQERQPIYPHQVQLVTIRGVAINYYVDWTESKNNFMISVDLDAGNHNVDTKYSKRFSPL